MSNRIVNYHDFSAVNPLQLIGSKQIDLLESTGSYDVERYPWAYECWKRQQQIHWMGEEIPLGEDLKDWQSKTLSSVEHSLLTHIFRFFTQSDVEVSDNYLKHYVKVFQPLEIQMMLAAFSNMETIHIDAYAMLLKTLGMPKTEFSVFREYTALRAKVDYMHTFGINTCADVARTLAMFGAFTEGMALFASFAMLLNFPRHNKMKGMGQIISWSVRDESLHCEGIIKLYHEWNNQTAVVNKAIADDIREVAKTMVNLEEQFIDLAFSLGDVEGMTSQDIKNYVHYICDWRLAQLKLQPIYGYFIMQNNEYKQAKAHPLPWLLEVLNGVEHANFFEVRATEYSKATSQGQWHGENGIWEQFDKLKNNLIKAT